MVGCMGIYLLYIALPSQSLVLALIFERILFYFFFASLLVETNIQFLEKNIEGKFA